MKFKNTIQIMLGVIFITTGLTGVFIFMEIIKYISNQTNATVGAIVMVLTATTIALFIGLSMDVYDAIQERK